MRHAKMSLTGLYWPVQSTGQSKWTFEELFAPTYPEDNQALLIELANCLFPIVGRKQKQRHSKSSEQNSFTESRKVQEGEWCPGAESNPDWRDSAHS